MGNGYGCRFWTCRYWTCRYWTCRHWTCRHWTCRYWTGPVRYTPNLFYFSYSINKPASPWPPAIKIVEHRITLDYIKSLHDCEKTEEAVLERILKPHVSLAADQIIIMDTGS